VKIGLLQEVFFRGGATFLTHSLYSKYYLDVSVSAIECHNIRETLHWSENNVRKMTAVNYVVKVIQRVHFSGHSVGMFKHEDCRSSSRVQCNACTRIVSSLAVNFFIMSLCSMFNVQNND